MKWGYNKILETKRRRREQERKDRYLLDQRVKILIPCIFVYVKTFFFFILSLSNTSTNDVAD